MTILMQLRQVAEPGRLAAFSVDVHGGDIVHLVGPNGAGKSTLLHRMAGLTEGQGQIVLNGKGLDAWAAPELARHRAYLAQQQVAPFAMHVWQYLALHQPYKRQDALVTDIADSLGLGDKLGRRVNELSGGEWQRVRLAAVVLQIHPQGNPEGQLLLLDEPMSGLDVAQQAALDRVLHRLSASGVAVVMSSHDLNHSLHHARRAWLLCKGELIAQGLTEEVLTPELLTRAYNMSFQRLAVSGHQMLISSL